MDNVKCCSCGFKGEVELGEETCPKCQKVGFLAWADEPMHEAYK